MTPLYYFGARPDKSQDVSAGVKARGIELIRVAPSDAMPVVTRSYTTPQYNIYTTCFAAFVKAAHTGKPVPISDKTIYYRNPLKAIPELFQSVTTVWAYEDKKKDSEIEEIKDKFNATTAVSRGKPCLVADLTVKQAGSLLQTDPITTTAVSLTTINVASYLTLVNIQRLLNTYLRVNQYSLIKFGEDTVSLERDFLYMGDWVGGADAVASMYKVKTHAGWNVHANLPQKMSDVNIYVTGVDKIPNEGGIIFPYVPELAREDGQMVPTVIQRYFFELLDDSAEGCVKQMDRIRSDWGTIKQTTWGDQLTHIFACIELAFQTGAMVKLIVTPGSGYNGCLLQAGHFSLSRHGEVWSPVSFEKLQSNFNAASPHSNALAEIVKLIEWKDGEDKDKLLLDIQTNAKFASFIRERGYNVLSSKEILKHACDLRFKDDAPLSLNSHNIARVLAAILDKDKSELDFPLLGSAFLEMDRTKRLLSAFGHTSFSFQIAGGQRSSLDTAKFTHMVVGKGRKKTKTESTSIFYEVVPWSQACDDMAETIKEKSVLTPKGTAIGSRASTKSIIREISDAPAKEIILSLQKLVGHNENPSGIKAGDGKRKAEDEGEGAGPSKKRELDFDIGDEEDEVIE